MTDLRHRVAQEIWNASYVYQELTLSTEPAQPELFLDAADAALAESLDAAWAEVEAALPEGWWIARIELSGMTTEDMGGNRDRLTWWEAWARGPKDKDAKGVADTPAAALRALAAKLREVA